MSTPIKHAKLSPSGAKRWMTCPGSIKLVEDLGIEDITSKYAAEGTVAHSIGDQCLSKNLEPESFLGKKMKADGFTFTVTEEMIEAVDVYVEYVNDQIDMAEMEADIHVEKQIEVKCSLKSLGVPGMDGGTSDTVLICREHQFIEIVDYKHGQGVAVEVDDNPQLLSYGMGALIKVCDETKTTNKDWKVFLTIVQPRAHHIDGPIRSTEITGKDLIKWCSKELVPAAKACHEPNAKFQPTNEGCRFCGAAGQCKALYQKTNELAMLDFEDDEKLPNPDAMTTEQKILVMDHISMLNTFISAVEKQVKMEVDGGSTEYEESYKLVRKLTKRKLTEDAVDEDLGELLEYLDEDEIFVKKHKPMGQIEKLLKKKHGKDVAKEIMSECTTKAEGDLVIAPLSDKRSAVQATVVSDFDDLD